MANNVDVLWFVDNDIGVPPNAGILIDQALQLGVVSGLYFNRRPPFTPQVYRKATEEDYKGMYWPLIEIPDEGLRQEDAVGAGCLAVRIDIFQRLVDHWKPYIEGAKELLAPYPQLQDIVGGLSPWFEFLDRKGEDLYFSERLTEIGQEIWVNYDVVCEHYGIQAVGAANFRYLMDNNLLRLDPTLSPGTVGLEVEADDGEE
jgi:hypothetical protein